METGSGLAITDDALIIRVSKGGFNHKRIGFMRVSFL